MIKCTFTSVWSDGTVTTPCEYDPDTGEVFPDTVDADVEGVLEREYISLPDGDELEVCPVCHEYVMKKVMGDRDDESYGEYLECRNPDCGAEV